MYENSITGISNRLDSMTNSISSLSERLSKLEKNNIKDLYTWMHKYGMKLVEGELVKNLPNTDSIPLWRPSDTNHEHLLRTIIKLEEEIKELRENNKITPKLEIGQLYILTQCDNTRKVLMYMTRTPELLTFMGIDTMWYFDVLHGHEFNFSHTTKEKYLIEYESIVQNLITHAIKSKS